MAVNAREFNPVYYDADSRESISRAEDGGLIRQAGCSLCSSRKGKFSGRN